MTPLPDEPPSALSAPWPAPPAWPRRPARWRARFSLGTARHPIRPPSAPSRSGAAARWPGVAGAERAAVASAACPCVVQKFGGTSVGDADRIRAVADHVARTRRAGNDVVVVVSAMGKTTDDLIRLADEVSAVQPPREYDMLVSSGERISMALLVHGPGRPRGRRRLLHRQPGRDHHRHRPHPGQDPRGPGRPPPRGPGRRAGCPVVAGFQGVSTDRDVTTLGRGGSDTTAVALAAALGRRGLRDLHRRDRGLQRRPPGRARRPAGWPGSASRRCSRSPPPAAGCCSCARSSSPATTTSPCTSGPASPGSRAPGSYEEDAVHGTGRRHRRHPRHLRGQGHRDRGARPARASPPGSSGPWPTGRSTST